MQNITRKVHRYLISFEYKGNVFSGFQKQCANNQPKSLTVQGTIEQALFLFTNGRVERIYGSSRTDAGVHAIHNTAHLEIPAELPTSADVRININNNGDVGSSSSNSSSDSSKIQDDAAKDTVEEEDDQEDKKYRTKTSTKESRETMIDPERLWKGVNYHLQKLGFLDAVRLTGCDYVERPYFHARYDAVERTYKYKIWASSEVPSLFEQNTCWHVLVRRRRREDVEEKIETRGKGKRARGRATALDVAAMERAGQYFVGVHDFSTFRGKKCGANSPIRSITSVHVEEEKMSSNEKGKMIVITIVAPSFLYHQVRLIVGALKRCGEGHMEVEDVKRILEEKNDKLAPPMAPAKGLFLTNVKYNKNFAPRDPKCALRSAIQDGIKESDWKAAYGD
jgi:tRNA pseudouridine38-40 synthase